MPQDDRDGIRRTVKGLSPRTRNLIKLIAAILATVAGLALVFFLAQYLLPFAIALAVSQLFEPLVRTIVKAKIGRGLASVIAMVLLFSFAAVIIMAIVLVGVSEVRQLAQNLPAWSQSLYQGFEDLSTRYKPIIDRLHPQIVETLRTAAQGITGKVALQLNVFATSLLTHVISLPRGIIAVTITILSTVLLMRDRYVILEFFKKQVPANWIEHARQMRLDLFSALFGYIKAQLLLMSVTFVELLIGLTLLGRSYALLLSVVIALVDALPIFGAGLFLIPYSIILFIQGQYLVGAGMAILYVVLIVVRQSIEPRVLGRQIGLHPLVTLMALYAGLKLWGVIGLIIGPVSVLILRNVLSVYMAGRTIRDILDGVERNPGHPPSDSKDKPPPAGRREEETEKPQPPEHT